MARNRRYNVSAKGRIRSARRDRTSNGLRRRLNAAIRAGQEDTCVLEDALAEQEEHEASGSLLLFHIWLQETYPLPKLRLV